MAAKVRFLGAVEGVAGVVVEEAVEDVEGEAAVVLQDRPPDKEVVEIWGIGTVGQLGEVTTGVLFEAGKESSVDIILDVGSGHTAGDFDPSKGGVESFCLDMVQADRLEELENFPGSELDFVDDGDLAS